MIFKGLKAQYIWYLFGGLAALLVLFAALYILGINMFVCLGIALVGGGTLFIKVYRLSNKYGEFGMMKRAARRMLPRVIRNNSRGCFLWNGKNGREDGKVAGADNAHHGRGA